MKSIVLFLLGFVLIGQGSAQDKSLTAVSQSNVHSTRIERILEEGGAITPAGFRLETIIPRQVAKAVEHRCEINCDQLGIRTRLIEEDKSYLVGSSAGDQSRVKIKAELGALKQNRESSIRYEHFFHLVDGRSFVCEGVYRIENKTAGKTCFVIGRTSGQIQKDGTVLAHCDWTGPVVVGDGNLAASMIGNIFERPEKIAK